MKITIIQGVVFKAITLLLSYVTLIYLDSGSNEGLLVDYSLLMSLISVFLLFDFGFANAIKASRYNEKDIPKKSLWCVLFLFPMLAFLIYGLAKPFLNLKFTYVGELFLLLTAYFVIYNKLMVGIEQANRNFFKSYAQQLLMPLFVLMFVFLCDSPFLYCIAVATIAIIGRGIWSDIKAEDNGHKSSSIELFRTSLIFWLTQVGLIIVFGLNEILLNYLGIKPYVFTYEFRYYMPIIAIGPIISNLLWAELSKQFCFKVAMKYFALLLAPAFLLFMLRDNIFSLLFENVASNLGQREKELIAIYALCNSIFIFISSLYYAKGNYFFPLICVLVAASIKIIAFYWSVIFTNVEQHSFFLINGIISSLLILMLASRLRTLKY